MHHYAFRVDAGSINIAFRRGGGHYALTIFLLLSAYGVAQSEKFHPTTTLQYFRKRLPKLLIPYVVILLSRVIACWFLGADADAETLKAYRVNPSFVELGQHEIEWQYIIQYILGIRTICWEYWFVGVTLLSYVAFGIAKSIHLSPKIDKRIGILCIYCLFILAFAAFTYHYKYAAHYYRNLWALAAGLFFSLYEEKLLRYNLYEKLVGIGCINFLIFAWVKIAHAGGPDMIVFVDFAFLSIYLCNQLFSHWAVRKGSLLTWLAAVSYSVYLVHITVLDIEWWTIGLCSALLAVVASVFLAALFQQLFQRIMRFH